MQYVYRLSWPPSVNSIWRQFRGRTILSKQGRLWYEKAKAELAAQKSVLIIGPVSIHIKLCSPTRRSYDPDNKVKGLFDSLVRSKVIEDDNYKIIRHYSVEVDEGGLAGAEITIKVLPYE